MADILAFPGDDPEPEDGVDGVAYDRFLLDEGLELLGDFRSIEDRQVRDALRLLVKSMANASRRDAARRS